MIRGRVAERVKLGPRPEEDLSSAGFALLYHDEKCRYFPRQLPFDYLQLRGCHCDPFGVREWEFQAAMLKRLKRGIIEQDELWVNKENEVVRLEDMSLRYLQNLKGFLEARPRAARFLRSAYWNGFGGSGASGTPDGPEPDMLERDPVEWLREQPLLRKVDSLIADGNDGPID